MCSRPPGAKAAVPCCVRRRPPGGGPCRRQRGCIAQGHPTLGGSVGLPRVLFFLSSLPRECVSVRGIREGSVAISGTHGSCLLVADGLAGRGHEVGVVVQGGQKLVESAVQVFDDLPKALRWTGTGGRVVWCSWGDVDFLPMLRAAGAQPWMWIHTGAIPLYLRW